MRCHAISSNPISSNKMYTCSILSKNLMVRVRVRFELELELWLDTCGSRFAERSCHECVVIGVLWLEKKCRDRRCVCIFRPSSLSCLSGGFWHIAISTSCCIFGNVDDVMMRSFG